MKAKNKYSLVIVLITVFVMSSLFSNKVQAIIYNNMPQEIRVGLVSMSNTSLTAVLNGSYTLNGERQATGTILNLRISNGLININGMDYSEVRLLPLSPLNLLTLSSGTSTSRYQGSFLFGVSSGKILPINSLDLESYLTGVVGYEMSDSFPLEALKAQAVAARNYALFKLGSEAPKGYDFDDTVKYQVYKGFDDRMKNVIRAVNETNGVVLLHSNKLVEALYSAWHGGHSEDAVNVWGNSVVYLKGKADSFENAPWPNGSRIFTNSQIDSTLKSRGWLLPTDIFMALDISSITRYTSGRVANINILYLDSSGILRSKSITRDRTRTFLNLPSNMFKVNYDPNTGVYTFSGNGNGHGLGMSQIGARNRALSGHNYEQILRFYFDGSYIVNLKLTTSGNNSIINSEQILTTDKPSPMDSPEKQSNSENNIVTTVKDSPVSMEKKEPVPQQPINSSPIGIVSFNTEYIPPQIVSVRSNGKMFVNTPVTIAPGIKSPSQTGISLRYQIVYNGRTIEERNINSTSNFTFTPANAGRYTITLFVKASNSSNKFDASKTFNINIESTPMKITKPPVRSGMKGANVTAVQTALRQLGYNPGAVDGIYRARTTAAVRNFQRTFKLRNTGIVDAATFNAMNRELIKAAKDRTIQH